MNKKIILLVGVLFAIPACRGPKGAVTRQASTAVAPSGYVSQDGILMEDGSIDSLVIESDGENPFSTQAITHEGDELTLEPTESLAMGDRYDDSSRHGLQTVYYDFDKKSARADQLAKLDHDVQVVKKLASKNYDIVVEGHACDSAGSPHYNLVLSEDRAHGVVDYFTSHGVDRKNLSCVGRGSEQRIVPFGNREQQAPNRRVEIYAYAPHGKKYNA